MTISAIAPRSHATTSPHVAAAQRVTVAVVTYNGAGYIRDCLRSLLESSGDGLEVVVVDNASTDGTPDLVRREFPAVRLLQQGQNTGYGAAANAGLQAAHREFLAVANQDLVFTPGWLEPLVAALDANPAAGLVTPKILLRHNPARVNTCGNAAHYTGITPCRGYNDPAEAWTLVESVPAVSGAAFLTRRELFHRLRGFDPSFFLYLEDTDLSLRAALAGYRSLCVPRSVVLHDFQPRFTPEKLQLLERNRPAMLLKLYQWRTLALLAPALLAVELLVLGYCLLRGPRAFWGKLQTYGWVLAHLPDILAARRHTQASRRASDAALLAGCDGQLLLEELQHPLARLAKTMVNPLFETWHRVVRWAVHW
ncbi:MAG: glycosyltransferase family 2 protein [Chloroflexi bacterium]|nr:glycosyltransferase family 2 protein [Chloroflexota bacterium]